MDELIEWYGAQLDEDERIANEAGGQRGQWRLATPLDDAELGDASWLRPPYLRHVERHDPARVLREVEAKRQILALHVPTPHQDEGDMWPGCTTCSWRDEMEALRVRYPCKTVRLLALPYADRPGYREEWRP
ncbi:DUF6221 family protein [Streptomyces sp. NBC_01571]|uniref:DUF6221 family protein n=1 Tax=Streptomyces sp. NBC_01571 TaxID=2975883 RepID=UPI00224CA723|nr:DUF6221 family protein [Streptomyces sp. NBC_01571]MCX4575638.1 DUF6221 family protein [Streptomyces sp. NBC_01571]